MKQITSTILLVVLMSMSCYKSFAYYDIKVENADGVTIYYNYINDGKELEVTTPEIGKMYEGAVVIPEEVTYMNRARKVTGIGPEAFGAPSKLSSITIPNSVTYIGGSAFAGCGLSSITIPNSVTSIGGSAFAGCEISSITIPNSVTYIGGSAFDGCKNLSTIIIGNGITFIGSGAFYNINPVSSVHISDLESWCKIKMFKDSFYYTHKIFLNGVEIRNLEIPNSVTRIENYVFYACNSLTSVTIPNSVTAIGENAFRYCKNLTSISIGNGLTKIEESAFYGCDALTSVHISDLESWCKIEFKDNPLWYAQHLYMNGVKIKDLIIPNGVTSIGKYVFSNCKDITSVTIPNSVTSIGEWTFADCSNLAYINIGTGLTSIENEVFHNCESLSVINIEIGNTKYDSRDNCNGIIETSSNKLIIGCKSTVIPNSVTCIGTSAFYCCSSLTSITIPNSVTNIEYGAFQNCVIQEVISKIENPFNIFINTFNDNTLYNATLYVPKGTINKYKATDGWKDFLFIEEGTGDNDSPVNTEVEINGIKYKIISDTEVEVIHKDDYSGDIIIPETVITNNKEYKVTSIGRGAFNINTNSDGGCKITSIQIPNNVTSIGRDAFQNCELLKEVKMPDDIVCVDTGTFTGCRSLESITLPRKLQEIKFAAFTTCSGLKSIEIPNQVFRIEGFAFQNNKSLKTVITSHGLKEIYYYTFSYCDSLQTVVLGDNVEKIGCNAFEWCSQLSQIYSLNPTPPALNQRFDNGGSVWDYNLGTHFKNTFEWNANQNATLYVPIGSKEAYQNDREWGKFKNIIEFDPKTFDSSTLEIKTITNDEEEVNCYSLDGRKLSAPSKGVNIIKIKDGTVKKVLVK